MRPPADCVLIADGGVVRELERGGFLKPLFRLHVDLFASDVLAEREFGGAAELRGWGLQVVSLTGEEVGNAARLKRSEGGLSVHDAFACTLAQQRGWTMLGSGAPLIRTAAVLQLKCWGTLCVLERLEQARLCSHRALRSGLEAIAASPRCRLPSADVTRHLQRYSA